MRCRHCCSRTRVIATEHRADGTHRWLRCLECDALLRTRETLFDPPEIEGGPGAVLTKADVRRLRQQAAAGVSRQDLAAEYGIHRMTVGDVINRKTWANVA